jgi:uncharacterized protein (TIGR03437 family)
VSKRLCTFSIGILGLFMAAGFAAQPAIDSVVSATSSPAGLAPDSLATIFGSNLSQSSSQGNMDKNGNFPTQMGGVSVDISGEMVQLLFISDKQINFMVPGDLPVGAAVLTVHTGGANLRVNITMNLAAPGVFVLGGDRPDRGAIENAVTNQLEPFSVQTSQNPGGDKRTRLAVFGSGIRYAGNPGRDKGKQNVAGNVSSQFKSRTSGRVWDLDIEFAGAAPGLPGVDQINIVIPSDSETSGIFEITLIINGMVSNVVTIQIGNGASGPASLAAVTVPPSVTSGTTATGSVSLTAAAPGNGAQVLLTSSTPDLQIPASVTVPAGQTSASFAFTASFVANSENVTINGSFNGVTQSATTSITPLPCVAGVSLSSNAVVGGVGLTGTVTLTSPAPSGGMVVNLQSNNTLVQAPASVTVPAGQKSVTFAVTTSATAVSSTAAITASLGGCSPSSASVTVNPAVCVQFISLGAASVPGGTGLTGTVTLSGPAPAGGIVVGLQSSNPAAQPGASVTVPAGQTTATFNLSTTAVSANTTAAITASIGGCAPLSITVVITGQLCIASVSLSAGSAVGGSTLTGIVTLTAPAPAGGVLVNLQSNNSIAAPDTSVTIPAGQTSAAFNIRTLVTPIAAQAEIIATLSGCGFAQAALTVTPPVCVASVGLSSGAVTGGQDLTGSVTLTAPAPAGGIVVRLQSSDSHVTVPSSVTVPQGQTSATFKIGTKRTDTGIGGVAISASTDGCSASAALTVNQS